MMGAAALARLAVWAGDVVTSVSSEGEERATTTAASRLGVNAAGLSDRVPGGAGGVHVAVAASAGATAAMAVTAGIAAPAVAAAATVGQQDATMTSAAPVRSPFRRGVTLPSFLGGSAKVAAADVAGGQEPSDRALDESYRELLKNRMASTNKAPVPEIEASELDTLESLFHGADTNADGVVDFNEFRDVMDLLAKTTGKRYNTLQLRGLFRMADLDGSGSIDFNEFIHAQRRMRKNWGTAKAATMMMTMMHAKPLASQTTS